MANPEHVAVVQQGADAIDEWRRQHPQETLDLTGANLRGANLTRADLSWADLTRADLFGADLRGANLTRADLSWADLTRADLFGADLFGADLSWANLSWANLFRANLTVANLTGANLTEADLTGANLTEADLTGANLTGATLGWTVLGECNLAGCVGLHTVKHTWPSSIGVDTLVKSFRGAGNCLTAELRTFFLGAGVPAEFLAALPQILAEVEYCSAFVCYGEPDSAFAERLVKDLKARGVSCWLYALDATPGERTWAEIGRRRREAEKMVVLCSAPALVRDGVLKEIEEQIDEDPDRMVPVSLDNLWRERGFRVGRGERDLKPFLKERNCADFSNESTYEAALEKLLKGLQRQPDGEH